jgi:hypothetical protein
MKKMLPDFPKIKEKFREAINRYLQDVVQQEPLLSQFRQERHFEGNKMSSKTEKGELEESSYKEVSVEYSINREDVITKGPMAFIENIQKVAEDIKEQQAKLMLDKLKEVTDRTGQVVDGKGQPFSHQLFMEMLGRIQIDFDDQGNPYLPTVIVPAEMAAKLKDTLPEWEANPEYKKRFDQLIERKRKEWSDRESHRKLVD